MLMVYVIGAFYAVGGVAEPIIEILDSVPTIITDKGVKMADEDVTGVIELVDVHFEYPSRKNTKVLKGINLKIDPKDKRVVALCGTSGCGKSTIVQMVQRFYDPQQG
jgi:ATP-binding cassette, subfamily B (MDR/TAP), member 1